MLQYEKNVINPSLRSIVPCTDVYVYFEKAVEISIKHKNIINKTKIVLSPFSGINVCCFFFQKIYSQ
ncbi:hypothetical protein AM1BK_07430 [Neobacillus kokaensis]|uniref:Uncharacterized protein n=1 Tax=Neobacillus kokaensis TaxID=2759023 RepID=A0ABQ3N018_9BACI|nr:hypothetical protein AM1BK_07430 [Neobacillus kokaensis]